MTNRKTPVKSDAAPKKPKRFSKRRSIALAVACCVMVLAIGFTFSWFSSNMSLFNGNLGLGELKARVEVFDETGDLLSTNESTSSSVTTADFAAKNWSVGSANVRYIAITNIGSIDMKSFLKCQYITELDNTFMNSFYYCLTDITSDVDTDIRAYATNHYTNPDNIRNLGLQFSNMGADINMGQISKKTGDVELTRYYMLEYCCFDLPTQLLAHYNELSETERDINLNAVVDIKQANAPDPGQHSSNPPIVVDSAEAFLNALKIAVNDDTLQLNADIKLPKNTNVTILNRVNLNLNGFSLTVQGNLAYDTASEGSCTIIATDTSKLQIDGSLLIDTPNTNFELVGSGDNSISLGTGDPNQNCRFYVNALRDTTEEKEGFVQTNLAIYKKMNESLSILADMEVDSNTKVTISENSETGRIVAVRGSNDIFIENKGEIRQIDFTAMELSSSGTKQIYVLNRSGFKDIGGASVLVPDWAIGKWSKGQYTDQIGAVNTKMVNGAGASTKWTVSGSQYFVKADIESEGDTGASVERIDDVTYRVNLKNDSDLVEVLLRDYFSNGGTITDNAAINNSIKGIKTIELCTYGAGLVHPEDFAFMNSSAMQNLSRLDLSKANFFEDTIPENAMKNKTGLKELELPTSAKIAIGKSAFENTNIRTLTMGPNITAIGDFAFNINRTSTGTACIDVIWTGTSIIPSELLAIRGGVSPGPGLTPDRTNLFMYEYLVPTFKETRTDSSEYWYRNAFERYDFVTDDGYYCKQLSSNTVQIILCNRKASDDPSFKLVPITINNDSIGYYTAVLGENSFRKPFTYDYGTTVVQEVVIPKQCTVIKDTAFMGAKIKTLDLNGVTYLGQRAFASSAIGDIKARPGDFKGMEKVGAYAFSGSIGSAALLVEGSDQVTGGELNLSGNYTPDDNAFSGINITGVTLNLTKIPLITRAMTKGMRFNGATLNIEGCHTVDTEAFMEIMSRNDSDRRPYNNINARNIYYIKAGVFYGNYFNNLYIGLDRNKFETFEECNENTAYGGEDRGSNSGGIFAGGSATNLEIEGWFPDTSNTEEYKGKLVMFSHGHLGGKGYSFGTVTFKNIYSGIIPRNCFRCGHRDGGNYTLKIGKLVVDDSVKRIQSGAFQATYQINSFDWDFSNIDYIGSGAFESVRLLFSEDTLTFAPGVYIGDEAFRGATLRNLKTMNIGDNSTLKESVFRRHHEGSRYCNAAIYGLENLNIGNNVKIGGYSFYENYISNLDENDVIIGSSLKHLTIGDNTTIGSEMLGSMTTANQNHEFAALEDIRIGSNTVLGSGAFNSQNLASLKSIVIGEGTDTGDNAFNSSLMDSLETISINNKQIIGAYCFNAITAPKLETINVTGCGIIEEGAFQNLKVPQNTVNITAKDVAIMGSGVFDSYLGWNSVTLGIEDPDIDTSGANTSCYYGNDDSTGIFSRNSGSATLGVRKIHINKLTIDGELPQYRGGRVFSPKSGGEVYTQVEYDEVNITNKCTLIPDRSFIATYSSRVDTTYVDNVIIGRLNITGSAELIIRSYAFRRVTFLEDSDYDSGSQTSTHYFDNNFKRVTSIGDYAFFETDLNNLEKLEAPNTNIGNYAFSAIHAKSLKKINFSGAPVIGNAALLNAGVLENAVDVNAVNAYKIGNGAFDTNLGWNTITLGINNAGTAPTAVDASSYNYGADKKSIMCDVAGHAVSVNSLVIDGAIPRYLSTRALSVSDAVAGNVIYNKVTLTAKCSIIPNSAFLANTLGQVVIKEMSFAGEVKIDNSAFYRMMFTRDDVNNNYLNDVFKKITAINPQAFRYADLPALTDMNLEKCTYIGEFAFSASYPHGADVNLQNVKEIDNYAFAGTILGTVTVGNNAYTPNDNSFRYNATGSNSIFAYNGLSSTIEKLLIDGNLPLTHSSNAFGWNSSYGNSRIEIGEIEITANCREIPPGILSSTTAYNVNNNTGLQIGRITDKGNTAYGENAFRNSYITGSVNSAAARLADNVFQYVRTNSGATWNFTALKNVDNKNVFANMTGGPIKMNFTALEAVNNSASSMFKDNAAVMEIAFGSSLTKLRGSDMFQGCSKLTTVRLKSADVVPLTYDFSALTSTIKFYVPSTIVNQYKAATYWKNWANRIVADVKIVGDYSFCVVDLDRRYAVLDKYFGEATTVRVPATIDGFTVVELSAAVFSEVSVTSLEIPNTMRYMNPEMFTGSSISAISMYDAGISGVTTNYNIISNVIYNKDTTTLIRYLPASTGSSFTVPETVTTISSGAFKGAANLETVSMKSVSLISESAFANTTVSTYNISSKIPPRIMSADTFNPIRSAVQDEDGNVIYVIENMKIYVPVGYSDVYRAAFNYEQYSSVIFESGALNAFALKAEEPEEGDGEYKLNGFVYQITDEEYATITEYTGSAAVVTIRAQITINSADGKKVYNVTAINPLAFDGCDFITAFKVDEKSKSFAVDEFGVLYTKDMKTLVRYPAAAEHKSYSVPEDTTQISAYAFADCVNLKQLYIPLEAMRNMGEKVFNNCNEQLALYGGAATLPTLEIKETAALPVKVEEEEEQLPEEPDEPEEPEE